MQSNRSDDFLPEGSPVMSPDSFGLPEGDRCRCYKALVDSGKDRRDNQLENIIVPLQSVQYSDQTSENDHMNKINMSRRFFPMASEKVTACFPALTKFPPSTTSGPTSAFFFQEADYAYWPVRPIRDAIFGQVWYGMKLKRITVVTTSMLAPNEVNFFWKVTHEKVAIKEMYVAKIEERIKVDDRENPYREIAAMQHLERMYRSCQLSKENLSDQLIDAILDTNVMMPLDVLTNDTSLFCVMPFCDGCEMFSLLADKRSNKAFNEEESRFLFKQILNGIETLQKARICHLDISLENLMTTSDGKVIIIDFGGCIKIPYEGDKRCLVKPFTLPRGKVRGKPYYISNEILTSEKPFDGHAVDMWSLGPILHILVFGRPPWEFADKADRCFHYFSNGRFKEYASLWNHGLSSNIIDLLQKMFILDPKERLSLEQVKAHPWLHGPVSQPSNAT